MRIIANRNARDHLQRRRIHNRQSLVGLGEHKQRIRRSFNGSRSARAKNCGGKHKQGSHHDLHNSERYANV